MDTKSPWWVWGHLQRYHHKAQSTQTRLAWDLNIRSGLPDGPKAQFKELNYSKHGWALTGLAFEEK